MEFLNFTLRQSVSKVTQTNDTPNAKAAAVKPVAVAGCGAKAAKVPLMAVKANRMVCVDIVRRGMSAVRSNKVINAAFGNDKIPAL